MEKETPKFAIIRLGKDSVSDIKKLDSLNEAPSEPVSLTVSCKQVPLDVVPGFYALICFGSDNSKGIPTEWTQGLRALGKITSKEGGSKYGDNWKVGVEVKIVLPESINKKGFLSKAAAAYTLFSEVPIIGLSSYSNQTIQKIKTKDPNQDICALLYAINLISPDFSKQVAERYPKLSNFLNYTSPSQKEGSLAVENEQDVTQGAASGNIEGLDTESLSSGWDEYPLDSVFVRKDQRTVSEIMRRIEQGRYVLNPDFQRDFLWSPKLQSRLIESCLMRIPLPVFYVAESKDGKIIVVDGLQRLTTFYRYMNNKFALTGLGKGRTDKVQDNPLLQKKFKDLPLNLQERLEDTQLALYILDSKAPERAKLDIFERVNGGVVLSRQQMRNCLFSGSATKWLKVAAESKAFFKTTGGSLDKKSMRDREAINRFCAFRLLGVEQYKGDMDDFLASSLEVMNDFSEEELANLTQDFERSLEINYHLFGKHAFRKSLASNFKHADRTVINIALFDVCSVHLSSFGGVHVSNHAELLRKAISSLLNDEDFNLSITYGTNGIRQVNTRFKLMKNVILGAT